MKCIKYSAAELNWNQRTWRSSREVAKDGGGSGGNGDYTEKGWKGEKRFRGRKAAGQRVWRNQNQWAERYEEAGRQRHVMAEMMEKGGR